MTSDEKVHLSGESASVRVALAVYRSGNGWLAYHPQEGTLTAPVDTSPAWLQAVPHMKMIAHDLPHLEAHAAFDSMQRDDIPSAVPQKSSDCTLSAPASDASGGEDTQEAEGAETEAQRAWPQALPSGKKSAAAAPAQLRLDVGWSLWNAEAEGADLQYQACITFRFVLASLVPKMWRARYSCACRHCGAICLVCASQ